PLPARRAEEGSERATGRACPSPGISLWGCPPRGRPRPSGTGGNRATTRVDPAAGRFEIFYEPRHRIWYARLQQRRREDEDVDLGGRGARGHGGDMYGV